MEVPLEILTRDLSGKILFSKILQYQDKIEIGNELVPGFYIVEVKANGENHIIPIEKQ